MENHGTEQAGVSVAEIVTIFVHVEGRDVATVDAETTDSLGDVLGRAGLGDGEGIEVFIGECADALDEVLEVEDGEDAHQPIGERGHSLKHHGVHHGHHIHCHRCHRVRTGVIYNGVEKHHRFSPATTIDTVRQWALKKFKISAVDGETLILVIVGVEKPPSPDTHIGDLVKHDHCELALELVPDHRING